MATLRAHNGRNDSRNGADSGRSAVTISLRDVLVHPVMREAETGVLFGAEL
ncbi:MAG: hypothetical protein JWR63_2028, partial [Conexibacter sp.]|nr:hypothetical protein [Conexibacter sp.]